MTVVKVFKAFTAFMLNLFVIDKTRKIVYNKKRQILIDSRMI